MKIALHWLKLDVNIFAHNKIRKIRRMPDGDSLFTLWVFLMCQGMKNTNNPGVIEYTPGVPFSDQDLADESNIKIATVQMGLKMFSDLGMIIPNEQGSIEVKNIRAYQSIDELEYKRALNRNRVYKHREKKKLIELEHVTHYSNDCNETIEEKRIEKKREEENRKDITDYKDIVLMWNSLSIGSMREITNKRKKKIKTRLKENSNFIQDLNDCIELIRSSKFLKGESSPGWKASFDWLIDNDTNYVKVLEGKYNNNKPSSNSLLKDNYNLREDQIVIVENYFRQNPEYETAPAKFLNQGRIHEALTLGGKQ